MRAFLLAFFYYICLIDVVYYSMYSLYMSKIKAALVLFLFFISASFAFAQTAGISVSAEVVGDNVENAHLVSFTDGKYQLSTVEFDENMYGVVVDNPPLALQDLSLEEFTYVATSGEAQVRVTAKNGEISEGDYLTSSDVPGHAQKADVSGRVLGVALDDFKPSNPDETGVIYVQVNITPVFLGENIQTNLVDLLRGGFRVPFLTPLTSLRYIIAALVILASFILGFTTFARSSSRSIEALGRNPLARSMIRNAIIMNFMLTLIIIGVGLAIAYLILTL